MKETILNLFHHYPQSALLISILVSIIIALLGIIPSVFITAANILFFGFWEGTFISFLGESIGAFIAFILYRKGFKQKLHRQLQKFPQAQRLIEAENEQAFLLILSLRLLPFVPSGLVTFAASIGKVSATVFLLASSLGKMPALLIEAYSVYQVTRFGWQGKLILVITAVALVLLALKKSYIKK
jgi:uncharacterized membrane protein YdjX (TVP38/TMEM64 family)